MNVLDLFSGIGGFSLGLERTGMRTVAFCEIEPYNQAVLGKHWPGVPCFGDVRDLSAQHLTAAGIRPDIICGGFPCQDISEAGRGDGIEGSRSGLWSEYARLIGEIRPKFVIVENVAALLGRGLGKVLGDLAALGFDAEWDCIPASAVGAPHRRDRIWIVAYPECRRRWGPTAHPDEARQPLRPTFWEEGASWLGPSGEDLAVANSAGHEGARRELPRGWTFAARGLVQADGKWSPEPELGRVVDGLPNWAHRIRALGNAVVPQIPEIIGRAIMTAQPLYIHNQTGERE